MAITAWFPRSTAASQKICGSHDSWRRRVQVEGRAFPRRRYGAAAEIRCAFQKDRPSSSSHHTILSQMLRSLFPNSAASPSSFLQMLNTSTYDVKNAVANILVDMFFQDLEEVNINFEGNFGPVDEIGSRVEAKIIEGAIPHDFPIGVYIRNGPNPQFGGKNMTSPLLGDLQYHWFDGDGMLHATYFGPGGVVSYQNKYVETKAYKEEKKKGKQVCLNTLTGDSKAIVMAYLINLLRFNDVNKEVCNITVFTHNGRLFANSDAHIPYEISPHTLRTLSEWDIGQKWGRPFTSHPKTLQQTGDMIIFGFSPFKPYLKTGIIPANGGQMIGTCDIELDIPMYTHDFGVTKNFDLIMYMPLIIDVKRLLTGESLLHFDDGIETKFGIKPRGGDASSVQWFHVEPHYTFHVVNSYEEGDEVILHGFRAKKCFLTLTPQKIREFKLSNSDPNLYESHFTRLHEWRFNMKTGSTLERNLVNCQSSMDMPNINPNYVGLKYKYAYAQVLDHESSNECGLPKYGKLTKITFLGKDKAPTLEFYDVREDVFFSEPCFVPSPDPSSEDDGWVLTYAHDERSNCSEVHIIDAKRFSNPPVARIGLPQRVPYGFHGTFMHGLF